MRLISLFHGMHHLQEVKLETKGDSQAGNDADWWYVSCVDALLYSVIDFYVGFIVLPLSDVNGIDRNAHTHYQRVYNSKKDVIRQI